MLPAWSCRVKWLREKKSIPLKKKKEWIFLARENPGNLSENRRRARILIRFDPPPPSRVRGPRGATVTHNRNNLLTLQTRPGSQAASFDILPIYVQQTRPISRHNLTSWYGSVKFTSRCGPMGTKPCSSRWWYSEFATKLGPSTLAPPVTLLTSIREFSTLNLGRDTNYPEALMVFLSPPYKFWGITSNQAMQTVLPILSNRY
jgi:hypothetical protein